MNTVAKLLGYIALGLLTPLWYGYVLSVLWSWFIVPTLHTPPITIPAAIGLSLVFSMFTVEAPKKGEENAVSPTVFSLGSSLIFLLIGYIIHLFM